MILNISKKIFWDINPNKLDEHKNKRLIIERVFSYGDFCDVKEIIKFYGIETIRKEIIEAGNLDNKTISWASNFLNIDKTSFKCFSKRQSNKIYWNF